MNILLSVFSRQSLELENVPDAAGPTDVGPEAFVTTPSEISRKNSLKMPSFIEKTRVNPAAAARSRRQQHELFTRTGHTVHFNEGWMEAVCM